MMHGSGVFTIEREKLHCERGTWLRVFGFDGQWYGEEIEDVSGCMGSLGD